MSSEGQVAEQAKIQKILIELNKTGLSYLKHLQFAEAAEFFKKAEKIVTEELSIGGDNQKISQLAGVTFNNLACYYKKTRKPKVALRYLKRSLELQVYRINDWVSTGSTHLNICAIYSYLGKHQDALSHVNLALELLQKKHVEQGSQEAKSYWNIRMLCFYNKAIEEEHLKTLEQSVQSYQQAKHIAQKQGTKNIGIIMNCDQAIARIESTRASIKKRMIDILMRKKQEEQLGHYDFMRKHKPVKRQNRVGSEHQLNRFDLYKSREGRRRDMTIKSQYKSSKVERGEASSRFKSLNDYLNQKYKTEGTEPEGKGKDVII